MNSCMKTPLPGSLLGSQPLLSTGYHSEFPYLLLLSSIASQLAKKLFALSLLPQGPAPLGFSRLHIPGRWGLSECPNLVPEVFETCSGLVSFALEMVLSSLRRYLLPALMVWGHVRKLDSGSLESHSSDTGGLFMKSPQLCFIQLAEFKNRQKFT